jgi:hypothetical protein
LSPQLARSTAREFYRKDRDWNFRAQNLLHSTGGRRWKGR